jgi:hypothetical protein
VKRSIFLLAMFFSGCALTASAQGMAASQPPAAGEPMGKITAAAVWQPSQDVITKAHSFCAKSMGAASFPECFMNQLAAAGAPAEAVAFMRGLYQHSNGQVGIMSAFKSFGHVDAAQVLYPLRANDNYGLLLVNGDPNLIDVDDMKKLDQAAMQQDSMFQAIKRKYPQTDVWPGDRSGNGPWPHMQSLPDGGTQFVVSYPLINGCHACQRVGGARFGWDFDASGKFLKTTFIPTPPPPKLLTRPHRPQANAPAQPPAPDQSTPQQ